MRLSSRLARLRGFLLLPVALALVVVAVLVYALNRQSSLAVDVTARARDDIRAQYVAEAGLQHAQWLAQDGVCAGDRTLPATSLGADSYAATMTAPGAVTPTPYTLAVDQDAWLEESLPGDNHGADVELSLHNAAGDGMRAVYRFDLSPLPAGAHVISATAWFYVTGNDDQGPVEIHAMNADWNEGGATWTSVADAFDAAVSASIPAQAGGPAWVQVNLTALVQAWIGGAVINHGIMLVATSDGVESRYTSREWLTASERPRLEVVVGGGVTSPVTVTATGTLANGVTRSVTREAVTAYQAPSTVVLKPGAALEDSHVGDGSDDDKNYGMSPVLDVNSSGQRQSTLLRFALEAVPRAARVRSATLGLYLEGGNNLVGGVLDLHRITRAWVEGERDGAPPGSEGGVTHNDYDGVNPWSTPGGDYDPTPIDSITIPTLSPGWYAWDVTAQVRSWFDGAQSNHGFLLRAGGGTVNKIDFTSSDSPTNLHHPRLVITLACECGVACLAPQSAGNILLVVRDAANMWAQDAYKKGLFQSWGYTVSVVDDDASGVAFDAGIAANDVAYVSETSLEASINTKLTAAGIGVVSEEGALNDELGIAAGYATPVLGDSIDVTDNSHYITAIFPSGPLRIYEAPMEGLVATNPVAGDLQSLAAWGASPALAVVESGGSLAGSAGTAAGRRVLLPFGRQDESKLDWAYVNDNGRVLVQRAIEWAAGAAGLSGPIAHWQLDDASGGIAIDSVGGHDGTLDGAQWTTGWLGGGLEFEDEDDIVDAGSGPGLDDPFAGGATVTAWIEPRDWGESNRGRVADKADSASGDRNGWAFGVYGVNQSLIFQHGFSGHLGGWYTPPGSLSLDSWQHVAVGYDNSSEDNDPVLYIDGVAQALTEMDTPSGSAATDAASNFALGNHALGTSRGFEGVLDDVRLYDRVLLAGEVAALAAEGGGGCSGTFRDEFDVRTYSGNDGSIDWATGWLEINEGDGPTAGDEQVLTDQSSYQLKVENSDGGGEGVAREADLSGAGSAVLRFDYRRSGLDDAADYVTVEVSANGGGSWTELDRFQGPATDAGYQSVAYDISTHIAPDTRVRFLSSPSLGINDVVYFDDVEIQCSP